MTDYPSFSIKRKINLMDGTHQKNRLLPALNDNYFSIDELSYEQLLSMGAEFSRLIPYFNLKNQAEGNWSDQFLTDESIVMANILSFDTVGIERKFLAKLKNKPLQSISEIFELAGIINQWFKLLKNSRSNSGEILSEKISNLILNKLVGELHKIGNIALFIQPDYFQKDDQHLNSFDLVWRIDLNPIAFPGFKNADRIDTNFIGVSIKPAFFKFIHTLNYIQSITKSYFDESLESGEHEPSMGLYLVFLKIFSKLQDKTRQFTQKHLDFYYERVLLVSNKAEHADSAFLLLNNQSGVKSTFVEKNTEFSFGKDAALNDIIYANNESIVVTDAKIVSLYTLYLEKNRLISPEFELDYITRIKSNKLIHSDIDLNIDTSRAWSIFGDYKVKSDKFESDDATIGFSISSPLLFLKEGIRDIELKIQLTRPSKSDVNKLVDELLKSPDTDVISKLFRKLFPSYLLTFKGNLNTSQKKLIIRKFKKYSQDRVFLEYENLLSSDWQEIFYKLFRKVFCIELTTDAGWLNVSEYIMVPFSEDKNFGITGFRLLMTINQDAEAITSFNNEIHGSGFDTAHPILKCTINPKTNFFPYSVFENLIIQSFNINVDVTGIQDTLAYNQHGQLDSSKPFQPFGPLPKINAFYIFGNHEIASKPLIELNINIKWGDLPRNPGGFESYYAGYDTKFTNNTLRVGVAVLSDGIWQPSNQNTNVQLFENQDAGHTVSTSRCLPVNVLAYSIPIKGNETEESFKYNVRSRNGFFRLALVSPDTAFGHSEYPEILTKTLTANAKLKIINKTPNPPYTPLIEKVLLSYKAISTISPESNPSNTLAEKIFHIHPFGIETVYPKKNKPCYLFPQYGDEGNLYIGLSASDISGTLTLFFHFSEKIPGNVANSVPKINWSYLTDNTWKSVSIKHILLDSTSGFSTSGIVSINVPADISRDNSVMPAGLFWIRASILENISQVCEIYTIQTNGINVTRKSRSSNNQNDSIIDSKWLLVKNLPGIEKINQIGSFFGGMPLENYNDRKTRVSERLRHKNRAVTALDYEQLVLVNYPNIQKVKCFCDLSLENNKSMSGKIIVVVVPLANQRNEKYDVQLMLNSQQLNDIRQFLVRRSSPFAKIQVINPVYEIIQVRCTVNFMSEFNEGENINRLNRDISDYICPWTETGYRAKFGWKIRQKDIESHIRELQYVEFVTNFSMLHITVDNDERFSLHDSAVDYENRETMIKPRYPWSLALPDDNHFIETMHTFESIRSEITGINELEIGGTLIIGGKT